MKVGPKLLRKGFLYNNVGYDYTWFQNHETTADIIDTGETNQYHECFFKFIIINNKNTTMLINNTNGRNVSQATHAAYIVIDS